MATIYSCKIFILVCALVLTVARADKETDIEKFAKLKNDVFGFNGKEESFEEKSQKITKMTELIKGGNIPAEVQGETTLNYLIDLVSDCSERKTCNLEADLARVNRLKSRETGSPSLHTYLNFCTNQTLSDCAGVVYQKADKKLKNLDKQSWSALDNFAVQAEIEMEANGAGLSKNHFYFDLNYHAIVLKALRWLDPEQARKVSRTILNRKKLLREFMNRIRQPCITFLQNLDPLVDLYPIGSYGWHRLKPRDMIQAWSFLKQSCEHVIAEWNKVVEKAESDYKHYLVNQSPRRRKSTVMAK